MPLVRSAGRVFFPLDEELALLPGPLTPALQETVVRLGTRLPFDSVVQELADLKHVTTTEATVRRHTEVAGATYVAWQTAEVEAMEYRPPAASTGAARQLLSADGAMVPLVKGEWDEVKRVVIGAIQPPMLEHGATVVHTTPLSYFSRLAEADTFNRLATVETHRRGTERAELVCAVSDGAEWIQGFVDLQRQDAVRILDFSHAAGYIAQVGNAVHGEGTPESHAWLTTILHTLKHDSPAAVVQTLQSLQHDLEERSVTAATWAQVTTAIHYLDKRVAQMDAKRARFQAAGYPIGSGSVESGHKVVVEARLKGAGMHWACGHVNPMVALHNALCSDRWKEDWTQIAIRLRADHLKQRQERQRARWTQHHPLAPIHSEAGAAALAESPGTQPPPAPHVQGTASSMRKLKALKAPYRPSANHPWRHSPIGRARFKPARQSGSPKL